ncbi:MAG: hypothetical protein A2993_01490 [Gammaproteobacteria bacterium RIFCSPLOWO2_01_FULL_47_190]|nr:MAG: hypothetical protein A2993_01490 [Gammaproteobacteria bacterium RIFCSPLOWO2_01_FULL_47_190]OGT76444.1 MAG: hypothetical protein A2W76_08140 [Gammaproteobacteria bacterium RIFCSPLOWO2_12_47_11]OGT88036.1 MAG: hypothetical protein A3G42_07130 [Gammaproteobacteria bacterium RIFCSPLOWO2_12_FULL_47_76]
MSTHNKNCFRSQGGAVIEMNFKQSGPSLAPVAGISHIVLNDESNPPKFEIRSESHGLNKRYYFYD